MGGISDMIFGSSDSGGFQGNVSTLLPGQENLLNQLVSLMSGQLGQGVSSYGGQVAPGASNLQNLAFGGVENLFSGGGAYGQGAGALESILGDYDPSSALEFFNTSVKQPVMDIFKEDILPQTLEPFVGMGALSSSAAMDASKQAGEDVSSNLGNILGNLVYQGEQSHLGRQAGSLGQSLNFAQMPINAALQAGGTQYGIESAQNQEGYNKWLSEQGYNNPYLSLLNSALGTQAFSPVVQAPSQSSGLMGMLAPGIGQGIGQSLGKADWGDMGKMAIDLLPMAMSFFSSEKYKKDIEKMSSEDMNKILAELEETDLFRYRYKWEGEESHHLGVITEKAPQKIVAKEGDRLDPMNVFGFLMASVKALNNKVRELEGKISCQ